MDFLLLGPYSWQSGKLLPSPVAASDRLAIYQVVNSPMPELLSMASSRERCKGISSDSSTPPPPRSGELRTQKLKSHLVRTQSLNVLPLKLGVGQYIAIHATLTARDFFLVYFYPSGPFTCTDFPNLSRFFLCWLWLAHASCVGPQNKIGCRFLCCEPVEYK